MITVVRSFARSRWSQGSLTIAGQLKDFNTPTRGRWIFFPPPDRLFCAFPSSDQDKDGRAVFFRSDPALSFLHKYLPREDVPPFFSASLRPEKSTSLSVRKGRGRNGRLEGAKKIALRLIGLDDPCRHHQSLPMASLVAN